MTLSAEIVYIMECPTGNVISVLQIGQLLDRDPASFSLHLLSLATFYGVPFTLWQVSPANRSVAGPLRCFVLTPSTAHGALYRVFWGNGNSRLQIGQLVMVSGPRPRLLIDDSICCACHSTEFFKGVVFLPFKSFSHWSMTQPRGAICLTSPHFMDCLQGYGILCLQISTQVIAILVFKSVGYWSITPPFDLRLCRLWHYGLSSTLWYSSWSS